jgi:biotin transport system permease protein
MLTLYISQNTWLHAMPASQKLLALGLASVGLLHLTNWLVGCVALLVVIFLYASLGSVGLRRLGQSMRMLAWMVILIAGMQALIAGIHGVLNGFLLTGIAVTIQKLTTLILLAELVTITTRLQAIMDAIEPLLKPLAAVGLPPERLALAIGLLIRTASLQRNTWFQLQRAYLARGVKRPSLSLIAPSLRSGLRCAEHTALALRARRSFAGRGHSQLHQQQE